MDLIFDFDGTIADSLDFHIESANKYLRREGKRTTNLDEVKEKGIKKLIKERNINILEVSRLLLLGRKEIAKDIPKMKIHKGMRNVIVKLSKNHNLGIITTNSVENVKKFLKNHKLANYFDYIHSEISLFGKDKKLRKVIKNYKMKRDNTVYIGDESRDVEAAKKAGIKSIAVAWGFESEDTIKRSRPNVFVKQPKQILEYLSC